MSTTSGHARNNSGRGNTSGGGHGSISGSSTDANLGRRSSTVSNGTSAAVARVRGTGAAADEGLSLGAGLGLVGGLIRLDDWVRSTGLKIGFGGRHVVGQVSIQVQVAVAADGGENGYELLFERSAVVGAHRHQGCIDTGVRARVVGNGALDSRKEGVNVRVDALPKLLNVPRLEDLGAERVKVESFVASNGDHHRGGAGGQETESESREMHFNEWRRDAKLI